MSMIAALLLVCPLACAQAAEPLPADELALQVRRLVSQLDADSLAEREAAEQKLLALGPGALDHLPPVTRSMSAEVKVRLQRVRNALERARAQAAAEPSRVTLRGTMPLSAALAAMRKQTGNRLIDFRPHLGQRTTDAKVDCQFDRTPFWVALDRLLDQAHLTVYSFSGEQGVVALAARGAGERPRAERACYAGAFRLEGVAVLARRDLRNPTGHALHVTLEATWEPRLTPILLEMAMDQTRAVGDDGRLIPLATRAKRLEIPLEPGVAAAVFEVPLALPDRAVRRIASLKGKLNALVPGRIETFQFENVKAAAGAQQRKAGAVVTVDNVRKNADVYEVRVRVHFDHPANALESHRGWIFNNEAYLIDPDGQTVDNAGFEAYRQTPEEVGIAYLFDREGGLDGCKLVYKTPVAIMNVPVEFELKDIELP